MIDSFSRLTPLLAALVLLAAAAPARSADEPAAGGTFSAPGYPQSSVPSAQRTGAPGAVPGSVPTRPAGVQSPMAPNNGGTPARGMPDGFDPLQQRQEPPPKPSVFQRFVESATGQLLQPFGASFFADAQTRPSTLDNVPVSGDYAIGPGDEVIVRAWGSIDVDYRATVDRNGALNLPKVGNFVVAGVKANDLERHLRAQIGRLYTNFSLSVSLGQLRGLRVFVVGPAQRPGVYTVPSQSTLLAAVTAAGGPAPNGSMRKISLRRDGKVVADFDVYEFLISGDKTRDLPLAAGDVIVFSPAGPRVALTGTIDTPAIFELKSEKEALAEVLRYAGGVAVTANPNRVQVERIDASQSPAARFVEDFRLDATGLAKPLRDGDLVTFLGISPQFANAVTLKGHVAQPLRYPWKPGMRIRDLIPDREALVSPDFYRRKNLLVQMIEDEPAPLPPELAVQQGPGMQGQVPAEMANSGGVKAQNGTAVAPAAPAAAASTSRRRVDRTVQEQEDREAVARSRNRTAALFEELNWDYAVVERLDPTELTTKLIPFNLGRAVMQGDPIANIELKAGDVVTVYSQKDVRVPVSRQSRLVSLEGEVAAPGVYQIQPGETLRALIRRVGGITPQAYLYGLELSREETRLRQKENLAAAIARLEVLQATQAAREAANRGDESVSAGAVAANTATRAQISRLSRLEPSGRIALELGPQTATIDELPDVLLDHGDRVIVPPRPGFVTVSGAVANTNSFLWKPGRTVGDYIRLAGLDEAADPSNMFILRADGTVSHANDRRGLFGRGNLEAAQLDPGDALIVPNRLEYESWGRFLVRNLKDWSQIFSQFGLGAAAINSLKN